MPAAGRTGGESAHVLGKLVFAEDLPKPEPRLCCSSSDSSLLVKKQDPTCHHVPPGLPPASTRVPRTVLLGLLVAHIVF